MSYQALARKWRPRRFTDVVGQAHVVGALTTALEQNRVHHAFLFTGTRGVGKTTLARLLAKALNCEQAPCAEPCGKGCAAPCKHPLIANVGRSTLCGALLQGCAAPVVAAQGR